MRKLLVVFLLFYSIVSYAQVRTLSGMVYEDDPKHDGYTPGKVYKNDGTVIPGLVSFNYSDGDIRLKSTAQQQDFQKFSPLDVIAFTLEKDSFATLSGFVPEQFGTVPVRGYQKGFVKVLVDGPVSLFKHYGVQSMTNFRVEDIESYFVGRKEERFNRISLIHTVSKNYFIEDAARYFRRDPALSADILAGKFSFLDLREIVKRYNMGYAKSEEASERSTIIFFRHGKNEKPEPLAVTLNDSTVYVNSNDLVRVTVNSRINSVCIGQKCTFFRSDAQRVTHVEAGSSIKDPAPFAQIVHENYAAPYLFILNKKKDKK